MLKLVSVFALLLTIGVGNVWGDVFTYAFSSTEAAGNKTWSSVSWTLSMSGGITDTYSSTQGAKYGTNKSTCTSVGFSTSGLSGTISSVTIEASRGSQLVGTLAVSVGSNAYTLSSGNTALTTSNAANVFTGNKTGALNISWTKSSGKGAFYIKKIVVKYGYKITFNCNGASSGCPSNISDTTKLPNPLPNAPTKSGYTFGGWYTNEGCTTAASAGASITANTTLYAKWTADASCDANPSIGGASLNGSFNLSTVGVQCASITPGSNCSVASGDYGFIWYANDGTKKEIGGTGVTKVAVTSGAYSSGSFSANLTSTFVLGNRYSVRAFATNGKPATAYSDTITFQPRSVTFNLNGHGSSTPTTQYVNNGGKATDPSYSESVTGYTFGGWYKEAGCSNSWTFGTDVVSGANKTLYAKWTAKTYTIDLDQDLTPTSAGTTSITATYNSNSNLTSAITPPTKTGWTFAGYYTEKNGSGTQIIDADGNVIASVATYTDASKNWIKAGGVTLYAKWTCTVTWSVSGATNVYSAQTVTYNSSGCKVASVPSGSDLDLENDYCGDKFMGWTSDENYVHGTSNLFMNVAGSPNITGDVTFYAVFADYAD
jgi:uncharacterized repeat protein (TIGR02543 family)